MKKVFLSIATVLLLAGAATAALAKFPSDLEIHEISINGNQILGLNAQGEEVGKVVLRDDH